MTDLEKLKKTFKEIGLEYKIITAQEWDDTEIIIESDREFGSELTWDIRIYINRGVGYGGFECAFYFLKGKFQNHSCYE